MYCFFQTTTKSKRSFAELNLQLNPNEIQALQQADDLRNNIIKGNYQVIPQYFQLFFNKLKPILNKQVYFHPQFIYQPIVSKCFLKSPENSQEAFEIDYLMLIYTYCCESLLDSLQQIKNIGQAIIENTLSNPKDVDIILDKMKKAYTLIKYTQMNFNQLLPRLSKKIIYDFEEFSYQFFIRFSTYFILMANLFYYETMQDMNNDQMLRNRQNLCSTMIKLLIQLGNLGSDSLGEYLCYLSFYFKCLGYKSIIERYLYKIKQDDYKEKSFSIMILEIIELSQELKQICQTITLKQINQNEEHLKIFKIQAQRWIQFSDSQITAYSGIVKNPQPIQPNQQILLNLGKFNYFD